MNRYPTTFLSMLPIKIVRKKKIFPSSNSHQIGLDTVFLKSHLSPRGLTCPLKFYLSLVKIKTGRSKQADNTHSFFFFFNLWERSLGMYLVGYDGVSIFIYPHTPGCGHRGSGCLLSPKWTHEPTNISMPLVCLLFSSLLNHQETMQSKSPDI